MSLEPVRQGEDRREPGLQSALRMLRVLEAVAEHQPARVGELAPLLQLSKSTVQRCLKTLSIAGWITAVEGDLTRWALSNHARAVLRSSLSEMDLRGAAFPAMQALRDSTGETVHLAVPTAQDTIVIVERAESKSELRAAVPIGSTFPAAASASGIAMLAAAEQDDFSVAVSRAREMMHGDPHPDLSLVPDYIAAARSDGYVVMESLHGHSMAIGAAIVAPDGSAVAGITLLMPANRYSPDKARALGEKVLAAAREASAVLAEARWTP